MRISHKIMLIPTAAIVVLVVILVLTRTSATSDEDRTGVIETAFLPALEINRDLTATLASIQRGLQDAVATSELDFLYEVDKLHQEFLDQVEAMSDIQAVQDERLPELRARYAQYYELARGVSEEMIGGEMGTELIASMQTMKAESGWVSTCLADLQREREEQIHASFAQIRSDRAASNRSFGIITIVTFACMIPLVLLSLFVVKSISRTLGQIVTVADGLANGDMTRRLTVSCANDEVGIMAKGLNLAMEDVQGVLQAIVAGSSKLSGASDRLSSISQSLSSGAEESSEQAKAVLGGSQQVSGHIDSVAAAVEEMGASIQEISKNTSEAARVANAAVTMAKDTNDTVTQLGDSSTEIGNVIKVITSIAEQTNLLALNATIEAARAGEAGKGFAVVANEVKDLANQTANATEEIGQRIAAIQKDSSGAVEAISKISEVIANINNIQQTVAGAVEEQNSTVAEISRSVSQAAGGTRQIAESVGSVSEATDQTKATAVQTSTAAEELDHLAHELADRVGHFTLGPAEN